MPHMSTLWTGRVWERDVPRFLGDRSQVAHWLHMALRRGGSFVTSDPKEADAIFVAHYVRTTSPYS